MVLAVRTEKELLSCPKRFVDSIINPAVLRGPQIELQAQF